MINLADDQENSRLHTDSWSFIGDYTECKKCNRMRLCKCKNEMHRCEKCNWCPELKKYINEYN